MKVIKIIWTVIAGIAILVIMAGYSMGMIKANDINQQIVTDVDTIAWYLGVIAITLIVTMWNGRSQTPK